MEKRKINSYKIYIMLKQIENYLKTKFLQVPLKAIVITLIIIDVHCPCIITHDQGNKIKKKLHKGGRRKLTKKKKGAASSQF